MNSPSRASRVVRTVHQVLAAAVVGFLPLVAFLDLPAKTAALVSALAVALVGAIARFYNHLWPAEDDLDENPLG